MKFNWGHGIAIGIGAFMAFIIFMVVQTFRTNTDLTAEDYYSQELSFQVDIDARKNTEALESTFKVKVQADHVSIEYPAELQKEGLGGAVQFYRPENANLDQTFPITLGNGVLNIPHSELAPGHFEVKVLATLNGKNYAYQNTVTIPFQRP